ncbi:MAG: choice-of-anchor D domain-containing protein [Bacteroidota bacterium]
MKKNYALIILLFFCSCWSGFGQLNPGDIAFVQYNADGVDNFAFVALTDISDTEIIYFTDNEENSLSGGEGTITWTPPSGGVSCGTVIEINSSPGVTLGSVTELNDLNFNADGDSILAYQGSTSSPTFIAALSNDGGSWGGSNDGNLPPGLINGTSALAISPEIDNCAYNGATTNSSQSVLLSEINNNSNWTLSSNVTQQIYSFGSFVVTECGGTPTPELQLVDNTSTNQNCGYTIDFGDVASDGSFSDLTFDIENIGTADLNVSSFNITGDYSIVSPTAPLVVAPSASQTITVRFQPASDGILTGELTINSDDSNEGTCIVNLTGEGFTPGPNIVVRGVVGSNPTIPNGSTTPIGTNNTLFAQQVIGVGSQTKTFRIGNENGTLDLNVSGITLSGDTADFFVTESLSNPFAPDTSQDFDITFQPTTDSGIRTATVSIANSDSDKNPYTFVIQGRANCPAVSGSIFPDSGPAGTTIVVNSPGNNLIGATAELNGTALDFVSEAMDELIVRLPASIESGGPLSVELSNGCIFSNNFTLIDETISGCDTSSGGTVSDLFISHITDSPTGGLTYIELYNATGSDIDFSVTNYTVSIFFNGSGATNINNIATLTSGIITNGGTYIISAGESSSQCPVTGGDGSFANSNADDIQNGINFGSSTSDCIRLTNPAAVDVGNPDGVVDVWGVFGDSTWSGSSGLGTSGANFVRDTGATLPNTNYSNSDWIITNYDNCSEIDYIDIGTYDFSTGIPPSISSQSDDPVFACVLSQTLTVVGIEGFDEVGDSRNLTYQWYVNVPGSATWSVLTNNSIYNDVTTDELIINDISLLDGYQYYCQVRENDASCFVASEAIRLSVLRSLWNGSSWSEPPTISRVAVLNGNYNTNFHSSFEACKLIVNSGTSLIIADGDYVEVDNDLTVDGSLTIKPQGSFVQINNAAIVDGAVSTSDRSKIQVEKLTAPLETNQEYTYWSSPVDGETIANGLAEASITRRYLFNAQNYRDSTQESNNDNATNPGHDDIDDNGDDWQQILDGTTFMEKGVGYAATHLNIGFFPNLGIQYVFEGPFNNGIINVPIYRNDAEMDDNNWNFIGNPYPSPIALDGADGFLAQNVNIDQTVPDAERIDGAIYLWSHDTDVSGTANGNEPLNYSSSDYAIINGVDAVAGGDGLEPERFIPSGQGFFVSMSDAATPTFADGNIKSVDVIFNNAMRVRTPGSNGQFFRQNDVNPDFNKLRLNLTSTENVFSQILIGYVENASSGYDGMYFDAPKNLSAGSSASIYSIINGIDKKFAIQGRAIEDLSLDEVIPLGLKTSIEEATIYSISIAQLEGNFMASNPIYIKDSLLNVTHDLTQSDYTFTSETGTYDERFEIVFNLDATLDLDNNMMSPNDVSIVELNNGKVRISVGNEATMRQIEILDLLGRTLYTFDTNTSSEILTISAVRQSTYFARITLSNGQVMVKKAVKRN